MDSTTQYETLITVLALAIGAVVVVFLILRALVLWYWRVNEIVALLRVIATREARALDATTWLVQRAAAADEHAGLPLHAPVPTYAPMPPYAPAEYREAWRVTEK